MNHELTKDEHTIAEHRIRTADGLHKLYVQEWGNKKGVPILFLHGGPGGGCNDGHKRYFDAKKHRVVFLDQRGSGHSTPRGSLKNNQTKYLVEDIELIRNKLSIDNWHVEGASWGSTLALCYAIKYPKVVRSLIILGVFLGTKTEIDWLFDGLYRNFYPEIYDENKSRKFSYSKKADQLAYLKMFLPLLGIDDRPKDLPPADELGLEPVKIELYYLNNNCFLPNNYILNNARKLSMPVVVIQGRYDMVCPPISAYKLSQRLGNCKMHTAITGHMPSERESSSMLMALLYQLEK